MQQEMLLFIADISGYTSYMIRNQMEETHGTLIINELIKSVVKSISQPIEISKLEGDAVFAFVLADKIPQETTQRLLDLLTRFEEKRAELARSTDCTCGACSGIDQLQLKVIAHYGKASIDEIGPFKELSGVDVILLHRLLKNGVTEHCYLMTTDAALDRLPLPLEGKQFQRVEKDKDIGEIKVTVYCPEVATSGQRKRFEKVKNDLKMKIGGALLEKGMMKRPAFHNFPGRNERE